jgi:type II secretory pathway component PulK
MTERHEGRDNWKANKGSALLAVLVLLAMASLLALVAARTVSTAAVEMGAAKVAAQSEADIRAGIELGAAVIIKLGSRMRSAEAVSNLADRTISVRITNERAFIDLNQASSTMLAGLFKSVVADKTEAAALASAVEDWRGGSASQKLTAAAAPDVFSVPQLTSLNALTSGDIREQPRRTLGTRFFQHPAQLATLPGFTGEIAAAVLPLVTIASGSNRINPFIAPASVLKALPGVTPSAVEAFIQARDGNGGHDIALLLLGADKMLVTEAASPSWRLKIVSHSRSGRSFWSEAVIAIIKDDSEPFHVLYVSDH